MDVPSDIARQAVGHEVASTPKRQMSALAGMSALPSEADMLIVGINVCYVPEADIVTQSLELG